MNKRPGLSLLLGREKKKAAASLAPTFSAQLCAKEDLPTPASPCNHIRRKDRSVVGGPATHLVISSICCSRVPGKHDVG